MVEAPPAPRDEVEAVDLVASLRLKMAKNRWMVGALHPPYCCFNVDIQEHTFIMSVVHDCGQTSALPLSAPRNLLVLSVEAQTRKPIVRGSPPPGQSLSLGIALGGAPLKTHVHVPTKKQKNVDGSWSWGFNCAHWGLFDLEN